MTSSGAAGDHLLRDLRAILKRIDVPRDTGLEMQFPVELLQRSNILVFQSQPAEQLVGVGLATVLQVFL